MMKKFKKILILFDKDNLINIKFFDIKKFKKKIDKKFKVKVSTNLQDIKFYDYIFLVGFIKKIKILKQKKYYTVHESDLPKGRGFSPIKWQMLKGKNNIQFSLIKLNEKIDSGKIIMKRLIKFKTTDTFYEIKKKQMESTQNLFLELIKRKFRLEGTSQKGKPTYFKKLSDIDDKININKSLSKLFNQLRLAHPNHTCYFYKNKLKFYISIKKA